MAQGVGWCATGVGRRGQPSAPGSLVAVVLALVVLPGVLPASAGSLALASHVAGSATRGGNAAVSGLRLSADGRVAVFASAATDLLAAFVKGNGPTENDVYLYDRDTGGVTLVSRAVGSPATGANGNSAVDAVSVDGQVVLFTSAATNLVPGFTDGNNPLNYDVYLFDRSTGTVTLVSHADGLPDWGGDGPSFAAEMSTDGRMVLFASDAKDLVPGFVHANGTGNYDLYLYDRISGAVTLVSRAVASPSTGANQSATGLALSADGRTVLFTSAATNLVPGFGDANGPGSDDLYLYDRQTGAVTLVSHDAGGLTAGANGIIGGARLSADGRVVAFTSAATNLVPGFVGAPLYNVYLYDRDTREVTLVSHAAGLPATGGNDAWVYHLRLSADGGVVLFDSLATNLVAGFADGNGAGAVDVYLYDRETGGVTLVSHATGLPAHGANGAIDDARLSVDGGVVVFRSAATDLVPGFVDGNGSGADLYRYDRVKRTTTLVSPAANQPSTGSNETADLEALSADGRVVLFESPATDLVAGFVDGNGGLADDLYLWRATLERRPGESGTLVPRIGAPRGPGRPR